MAECGLITIAGPMLYFLIQNMTEQTGSKNKYCNFLKGWTFDSEPKPDKIWMFWRSLKEVPQPTWTQFPCHRPDCSYLQDSVTWYRNELKLVAFSLVMVTKWQPCLSKESWCSRQKLTSVVRESNFPNVDELKALLGCRKRTTSNIGSTKPCCKQTVSESFAIGIFSI